MNTNTVTATTTTKTIPITNDVSKITCTLHVFNFHLKLKEVLDCYARDQNMPIYYYSFALFDEKRVSFASLRTHHTVRPETLIFELSPEMISKCHSFRLSLMEDGAFGSQCKGYVEIDKSGIENLFQSESKTEEKCATLQTDGEGEIDDNKIAGDVYFTMVICSGAPSVDPSTTAPLMERVLSIGFSGMVVANLINPAIPFYPSASVSKASGKIRWSKQESIDISPLHSRSNSSTALISLLMSWKSGVAGNLTNTALPMPKNSTSGLVPPTPMVSPTNDTGSSVFLDSGARFGSEDFGMSRKNTRPDPIKAVKSLLTEQLRDPSKQDSSKNIQLSLNNSRQGSNASYVPATPACSPVNASDMSYNLEHQGNFKQLTAGIMMAPAGLNIEEQEESKIPPTPACSPVNASEITLNPPVMSTQLLANYSSVDSLNATGRVSLGSDVPPTPCVSPDFSSDGQSYLDGDDELAVDTLDNQKTRLFRSLSRPFTGLKRGSFPVLPPGFVDDNRKNSDSGCSTGYSTGRNSKQGSVRSSPKSFSRVIRSVSSLGKSGIAKSHDMKPIRLSADVGESKKRDRRHSRGAKSHVYMISSPSLKGPIEIVDHDREMFAAIRNVFRFSSKLLKDSIQSLLQSSNTIPDAYEVGNLVLKKLTKEEFHILLNLLPTYVDHVRKNPATLLPRYYGVLTVQSANIKKKAIVVMTNVYDKSLSWNRAVNIKCSMKETTITTVIDGNAVEQTVENADDNRKEVFPLPTKLRNETLEQLGSDLFFLKKWQLCNYGLEMGVHFHQDLHHDGSSHAPQLQEGFGVRRVVYEPRSKSQGNKVAEQESEQGAKEKQIVDKTESGEEKPITSVMKDDQKNVEAEKLELGEESNVEKRSATYVFGLTNCLTRSDVSAIEYSRRIITRVEKVISNDKV